jgi:hypothetical protein
MTGRSHRRLRAPTADGEALIDPPLSEAAKLIEFNRRICADFDQSTGFSSDHRLSARLLSTTGIEGPLNEWLGLQVAPHIVSGHQPDLYHPGVWLKNYVLSAIARTASGLGINLVIDSDTIRTASIRVPTGNSLAPNVEEIPFDASSDEVPWESREVLDQELFQSFAMRVRSKFAAYTSAAGYRQGMILDELWPAAIESKDRTLRHMEEMSAKLSAPGEFKGLPPDVVTSKQRLAHSLSYARRDLEHRIGLSVHDVPVELACASNGFIYFANHLLTRHRELHEVYNSALAEYRTLNRIRNDLRPVPNLSRVGDWFETPFWLWNAPRDVRRRRAFVRQIGASWEISDLDGVRFRLPTVCGQDMQAASLALIQAGLTLRPRALVTTMYARLVLSDLFIHGIGGAKYDEVTDEIIRRFFGIEPPRYITATATFRLPIERPHVTIEDVREVRQKLRDVRYRPENLLRDPLTKQVPGLREQLQALADEKREYVRTHDLRRCEEQVFARLDTINRAMHELLRPVEQELQAQHSQLEVDLRRAELLGSREFSFVLFPADELPERLLALSKVSA